MNKKFFKKFKFFSKNIAILVSSGILLMGDNLFRSWGGEFMKSQVVVVKHFNSCVKKFLNQELKYRTKTIRKRKKDIPVFLKWVLQTK